MWADVYYRQWNTRRESIGEVFVRVEIDADLLTILRAAEVASCKALTRRRGNALGVFQVQTDLGIFTATDDGSLTSYHPERGCKLRKQVQFKTWAQLEAEEDLERMSA